jgi:mannose-1-phosphate guanylyltransferase
MRAMILAAGLGTRLRPLTSVRPKALVPVRGHTVVGFWVHRLHQSGFEAVVLNGFHLCTELTAWIAGRTWPIPVEVSVEPHLLGTGGGIRNALDFFGGQPFMVINGDILCDAPLKILRQDFLASGIHVALLMHDFQAFNNVVVDCRQRVCGFGTDTKSCGDAPSDLKTLAFTGIYLLHPEVFRGIPKGRYHDVLQIFREAIHQQNHPLALRAPSLYWREMGSIASYVRLHEELGSLESGTLSPLETGMDRWIHPRARVASGSLLEGWVSIGSESCVMSGATVANSIVWERARLRPGACVVNCVVADDVVVEGLHENEILVR